MTNTLLYDRLLTLIETSIIDRYSGDLDKHKDPRDGDITYIPLDTNAIRELLTTLWGEHVSTQTIECVFEMLTEDGAGKWPLAYCEEDEECERAERLNFLDHEIECTRERLTELKKEFKHLAKFFRWPVQELTD